MGITLDKYLARLTYDDLQKAKEKLWLEAGGEVEGNKNLDQWRLGKIRIRFEEPRLNLFDKRGRRILPEEVYPVAPMKRYRFERQKSFDFEKLLASAKEAFPGREFPTAREIEDACLELEGQLKGDPAVSALVRESHDRNSNIQLPWVLPQMQIDPHRPGISIAGEFISSVKEAFERGRKDRKFHNDSGGALDKRVTIVDAGQLRLIAALAKGPVCGWIFPDALRGVAIEDQRRQMRSLFPVYRFSLGGFDALAAMIYHTNTLAKMDAPALALTAFRWKTRHASLALVPGRDEPDLWFCGLLNSLHGDISGTLSVMRSL